MANFEDQYNGIKNAEFILLSHLVLEIAKSKGPDGPTWLAKMRANVDSEVDDFIGGTPAVIDISKGVVKAHFDFAEHRLSNAAEEGPDDK